MTTFPQSAQEALDNLKSIPAIKQDYSDFRFSRLFHYDPMMLEGYSVTEKQWTILWCPEMVD